MIEETPSALLSHLENLKGSYGAGESEEKLSLLQKLTGDRGQLREAAQVVRLHELLCFLRAYPDDPRVLDQVELMLAGFSRRRDLRRHRRSLENSGIAGTRIYYRFFWFTALWLAQRWPDLLHIEWGDFEQKKLLEARLPVLMPYSERLSLEEVALPPREWIKGLKGAEETDAAFVVRRFEALPTDDFLRERFYEELDIPCRLDPGPDTPCRSRALYKPATVVFQSEPLELSRKSFHGAIRRPPQAVRLLSPKKATELIDLAREAMISRERDLDVFIHADRRDIRVLDCGRGLQFACFGTVPEWRQMLDSVYGFLILKNGIPIGYFLTSALFRSAEVAYNIFDTYRGGEAACVYGRALGMVRYVFGANSFVIDPYQIGFGNREALESGAWWFYYKLGFRPRDPEVLLMVKEELDKMKKDSGHRSSIETLEQLSAVEMFLFLGKTRDDIVGVVSRENIGYRVSEYLGGRFGADRERGVTTCAREAARGLGLRSRAGFSSGERLAWNRWSPLMMILPGVERWSSQSKSALVDVVRAKGGRHESEFVRRFDRHRPLRRAILKLAAEQP